MARRTVMELIYALRQLMREHQESAGVNCCRCAFCIEAWREIMERLEERR